VKQAALRSRGAEHSQDPRRLSDDMVEVLVSQASRGDYYTDDANGSASAARWHGPERLLSSFGIDPGKTVRAR